MGERPDNIGDALRSASGRLREAGIGSADLEAGLMLGQVTGLDRLGLLTRTATELTDEQRGAFEALLARRLVHEPFQYLTGRQEFMSLAFEVGPGVLVPRPETEHLVEVVLDAIADRDGAPEGGWTLADVGTGSGAIAISLASYVHALHAIATDVSPEALAIARLNAQRLEVGDRVEFRQGAGLDPLSDLAGRLDFLVSNPPYIPTAQIADLDPEVRDWEPRLALDGGPDGLTLLRMLAHEGQGLLKPGGLLAVEVMAGQAPAVLALLAHWADLDTVADLAGHDRVVLARKPAA